jgi:hypothetical protein
LFCLCVKIYANFGASVNCGLIDNKAARDIN